MKPRSTSLLVLLFAGCVGENPPPEGAVSHPSLGRTAIDPPTKGILHMTFDDGPSSLYTREIVDTLVKHHVPATFFVVGSNIAGRRDLLDYERANGMQIGSHSYYHEAQPTLTEAVFKHRTLATKLNIGDRDGGRLYYRFPYGAAGDDQMRWLEKELDVDGKRYKAVGWNFDSQDWDFGKNYPAEEKSAAILPGEQDCGGAPNPFQDDMLGWVQFIARRVGGGVILFHDTTPITRDKLDAILTGFESPAEYWKSLDQTPDRKQRYQRYYQCRGVDPNQTFKFEPLHSGSWPSFVR